MLAAVWVWDTTGPIRRPAEEAGSCAAADGCLGRSANAPSPGSCSSLTALLYEHTTLNSSHLRWVAPMSARPGVPGGSGRWGQELRLPLRALLIPSNAWALTT